VEKERIEGKIICVIHVNMRKEEGEERRGSRGHNIIENINKQ